MKRITKIVAAALGAVAMFAGSAWADYTLTKDETWTDVSGHSGTIDLAGHKLTVSSLTAETSPNLIQDGSFEEISVSGGWAYFSSVKTSSCWQAPNDNRIGITQGDGSYSPWTKWVIGTQAAFIQGDPSVDVTLQQEVQVPEDGQYLLTYFYAWRPGTARSQHLEVHVDDGPVLGSSDSGALVAVKEIILNLTAGPHTIKFVGTTHDDYATTILDDVSLRKILVPNLIQDGTFEGVTIPASSNSGTWGYFNGGVTSPHWQTTVPGSVGFTKKDTTWTTWANGSQAAFIQGNSSMDVTLQQEVQVPEDGVYLLTYSYGWRSGYPSNIKSQHLEVHVDDGPVLGSTDSGASVAVKEIILNLTAGPHTIKFVGTTHDAWATTILDDVSLRKNPAPNFIQDGTFEEVTIPVSLNSGTWGYFNGGVTSPHWQATVSNRVGFTKKDTTWTTCVKGSQAAYIQGDPSVDVTLQQNVQVPEDGEYLLTYSYCWRSGYNPFNAKSQHLEVHVDNGPVLGFTDSGASVAVKEIILNLTAGPHTIKFVGTTHDDYATTILDDVSLRKIPVPNLIQDGTFEESTIGCNNGTWGYFSYTDVTCPGWQASVPARVGVATSGSPWTKWVFGTKAAFIQGDPSVDVTLQQEVQVPEDGKYLLTYSYAWRPETAKSQHLEVHVDDGPVLGFTDSSAMVAEKKIVLNLTMGPHTIKFVGTTHDDYATTILDDVSLRKFSSDEVTITNTADAGYEILEYIDSDGNAYVNTGVTVADNTVIEIKLQLLKEPSGYVSYVGARTASDSPGQLGGWFRNLMHYRGVTESVTQIGPAALNTDYLVHLDKNGPCTINGGEPFATGNGKGNDNEITVFGLNQAGSVNFRGAFRVYFCTIAYGTAMQCDLRPARRLSDGALGLLDVKDKANLEFHENKETVGAFTAGPVVSDEFAHPAELHVAVASGETENSKVAITGPVRLVKEGAGTFVATKLGQTYTGGTDIKAGTFRCGECGTAHVYGADGSTVTVRNGAIFDCDGWVNHYLHHFVLDGGTMKSQNNRFTKTIYMWFSDVELTKNSFWSGCNCGFVGGGLGPTKLQMNDHVLTVDVTSGEFFACNLTVEGGGEIYMRNGGRLALGGARRGSSSIAGKTVRAETTMLRMGDVAIDDLGGEHVFGSYVSEYTGSDDLANTVIKVQDSFVPGVKWHATELQDGATLDLSACTGVWNVTCEFEGSKNSATATFAAGAMIDVELGGRTISAGDKVIGWTPETAPAKGVKFLSKLGKLRKMSDGAYYMQPFMIMIR